MCGTHLMRVAPRVYNRRRRMTGSEPPRHLALHACGELRERAKRHAVVASHFPHFGEEDYLRGRRGSGAIFFSGCNLRCVFCQNHDISWQLQGERVSAERLAGMMLELADELGLRRLDERSRSALRRLAA